MNLENLRNWQIPPGWLRITTFDAHSEGEPLRIVTGGFPDLPGQSILERRRYLKEHLDHFRTMLMWEPRGHREMYGCILTPPVSPAADVGVLFMHNEGYSTMCGHGIIALTTVAVQSGLVPKHEPETVVRIETPAGLITGHARVKGDHIESAYFENVPSFAVTLDESVEVKGFGRVKYDLSFGGAFYAYVDARQLNLTCSASESPRLVETGMAIKRAVMTSREIVHPFERDLGFLYGTIFIAPPLSQGADYRNVCIFADGQVDRSPTGTGVSGLMAILHARGEVEVGQPKVVESIIGSRFTGRIVGTTTFGEYAAVIPQVEGRAFVMGRHEFVIDPKDPLGHGFLLE